MFITVCTGFSNFYQVSLTDADGIEKVQKAFVLAQALMFRKDITNEIMKEENEKLLSEFNEMETLGKLLPNRSLKCSVILWNRQLLVICKANLCYLVPTVDMFGEDG